MRSPNRERAPHGKEGTQLAEEKDLIHALETLTSTRPEEVPETLPEESFERAKHARSWTRGTGIMGLGVSNKIVGGKITNELALKVYVVKKRPLSGVARKARVPNLVDIPGITSKLATDVEEIGRVQLEALSRRVRPVIPGYSVGHPSITSGTLGCLVTLGDSHKPVYILSNSHVLAKSGTARVGDPIIQPGRADGGKASVDAIATLHAWVPFRFGRGQTNLVDAALARLLRVDLATAEIFRIGVPSGVSTNLTRGMRIQKSGRTTEHTWGEIRDINYRGLRLTYPKPGGGSGSAYFSDQALCSRYSSGGDSGALVCDCEGRAVGLHFAGSPSTSIFSPIALVLHELSAVIGQSVNIIAAQCGSL